MSLNLQQEQVLPLGDTPKHVPGRPHLSTIYRWVARKNNHLETVNVGGRVFTTVEAIHRFIEGCNPAHSVSPPRSRQQQIERAERTLDAAGV